MKGQESLFPSTLEKPSITKGGMKEEEMKTIALLINDVLKHAKDEQRLLAVREEVRTLCQRFPLYPERRNSYCVKQA